MRADSYTRHLFASDASLYSSPPLLVAFPRDAADVAAAIRAAARFGVPVSPAAAAPASPARRPGGRLVLDTSRHMDAIVELDPPRGGCASGRAWSRTSSTAPPPRTASVRPGHLDLQPGDARRHDRQQLLGQPLDRLRHDDRPRARARGRAGGRVDRAFGPVDEAERRRGRRPTRSRARSTAGCRRSCASTPARSPRTTRSTGASPAATGSTARPRVRPRASFVTGSEGTLVAITEATVGLIELPKARTFAVGHFDVGRRRDRRDRGRAALEPAAVEMIDRRSSSCRAPSASTRGWPDDRGRSGRAAVRDVLRRHAEEAGASSTAWRPRGASTPRLPHAPRRDGRRAGGADEGPQGRARPADGGERGPRRPRRSWRTRRSRPSGWATTSRPSARSSTATGSKAGWYGHASVGCLHVRPFVDLTEPGGVETMTAVADEIRELVAEFDGVNSSEHGDGLRSQPVQPARVRRGPLRRRCAR